MVYHIGMSVRLDKVNSGLCQNQIALFWVLGQVVCPGLIFPHLLCQLLDQTFQLVVVVSKIQALEDFMQDCFGPIAAAKCATCIHSTVFYTQ